jgi:hypothetical protein
MITVGNDAGSAMQGMRADAKSARAAVTGV